MSTTTDNYGLIKPDDDDIFDVEHMNANSDAIDTELKKLANDIASNGQNIAANKSAIDAHGSVITANYLEYAAAQVENQNRLTALESTTSNNSTNIETNTSDISDLKTAVSTNTTNISTNKTNIATNKSNISTLTTKVNTNTSSISTNTTDISTLKEKVLAAYQIGILYGLYAFYGVEQEIAFSDFATVKAGTYSSSRIVQSNGRISGNIRLTTVTSAADCKLQVLTINSDYRPNTSSYVGMINFMAHESDSSTYVYGIGYINAGSSQNGIITLIFPAASTTYQSVEIFFDYHVQLDTEDNILKMILEDTSYNNIEQLTSG